MYVLLVIEKPSDDITFGKADYWTPFSIEIGNVVGKNPEIERLAENVLLIPYKCLFLESIPEWVTPKK